jgi:hypothetical protein
MAASPDLKSPVAFISSSPEYGGAEGLMLSIIDGLGSGLTSIVIFIGDGPVVEEVRRRGIPALVLPAARRGGLHATARRVRRALRSVDGTVVHANGTRAALVAAAATFGTRWKVVWMKVDLSRDGLVARALGRRCARVVGMSNAVNDTFRGRTRRRLRVVYPGLTHVEINRAAAQDLVRSALDLPGDAPVVVNAARLTPAKGQRDLRDFSLTFLSMVRKEGVRPLAAEADRTTSAQGPRSRAAQACARSCLW